MRSKCRSCGYLHHKVELNCSKCGSFYTEIIGDVSPSKNTQQKTPSVTEEVKHYSESKPIKPMESPMTKCLSCGHLRHDLELNCPKCGSFYSVINGDIPTDNSKFGNLLAQIKAHLEHPKHRLMAIGTVIFLVIAVMFL